MHVKKYETYIDTATKERCALLLELQRRLRNKRHARENISLGVSLVKKVIKADADADDLSGVLRLCTNCIQNELWMACESLS